MTPAPRAPTARGLVGVVLPRRPGMRHRDLPGEVPDFPLGVSPDDERRPAPVRRRGHDGLPGEVAPPLPPRGAEPPRRGPPLVTPPKRPGLTVFTPPPLPRPVRRCIDAHRSPRTPRPRRGTGRPLRPAPEVAAHRAITGASITSPATTSAAPITPNASHGDTAQSATPATSSAAGSTHPTRRPIGTPPPDDGAPPGWSGLDVSEGASSNRSGTLTGVDIRAAR